MSGLKHLIECHCYLKIYKKDIKNINHKFPVYSKFDLDGLIVPELFKCNNCDALHWVYDVCKSELRPGKDQTVILPDIEI